MKPSNSENNILIPEKNKSDKIIAIAGNPNVGKSTLFNALTGLKQHTGNWPGKTVSNATGEYIHKNQKFKLVDIPGTYSIMANSIEEEIARDFICFGKPDTVIVVMDATCIERNLNLALQILEITKNVVICINLIDEAQKKGISIDTDELSLQLGVPVVTTNARAGQGLKKLMDTVYNLTSNKIKTFEVKTHYNIHIEKCINNLEQSLKKISNEKINTRWLSLRLLDPDESLHKSISKYLGYNILENDSVKDTLKKSYEYLSKNNMDKNNLRDKIVSSLIERAESIYKLCVKINNESYTKNDRKIDKILTSKLTGIPIMVVMLMVVFWITLVGANYPSELLSKVLFWLQDKLSEMFININAPEWLNGILVMGIYRTLAWVVAVMLPPMAIFFPLFTLLEDIGYLPRVAFNLDKLFKQVGAHGKQALTMCMGFGCNACGVIGCRIIDSPRERLIAIITNNFVPCNGRFPTLITIITIFFTNYIVTPAKSLVSTAILTLTILIGVFTTFLISNFLSKTILKGTPSSFTLELPPYRKPQVGKVIIRSIFDRTIFVLARAIAVAAPAGLIIWIMSNTYINGMSIIKIFSDFLDPFAKFIGLDGVILMAFILGFPANEIVIPIIIMSYMCTGSIMELENLNQLHELLVNNGWTYITAICMILFSLMHFPCGTTCLTIKKETGSLKWTVLSFIIPTVMGIIACAIVSNICKLLPF